MKNLKRKITAITVAAMLAFAGVFAVAAPANAVSTPTVRNNSNVWHWGITYQPFFGSISTIHQGQTVAGVKYIIVERGQCVFIGIKNNTYCSSNGNMYVGLPVAWTGAYRTK